MSEEPAGLCASLGELAEETWAHMAYQLRKEYRAPDERAFTDHHLVELSIRHEPFFRAKLFDGSEEGRTGADFELWLQGNGLFLPALVQAKKLDRSGRYPELDRHIGGKSTNPKQITRLLKACEKGRFAGYQPLYLFYNGPLPAAGAGWPRDHCGNPYLAREMRGCAIARAPDVERVLLREPGAPHNRLDDIVPLCWPWSCLFCCPGTNPAMGLAARVSAFLGGRADDGIWRSSAAPGLEPAPRLWTEDEVPEYMLPLIWGEGDVEDAPGGGARPGARRVVLIRRDAQ